MRPLQALYMVFIICISAIAGCGRSDYGATIRSARTSLPTAVEMERLFGSADHFITHYGFQGQKTNKWNTVVFFDGRYTLTMQVDVRIDYQNNSFNRVADPVFYLSETEVVYTTSPPVKSKYGTSWTFSEAEWKELFEHNGDFSTIGIQLRDEPVANFEAYIKAERAPRLPAYTLTDN